MEFKPFKEIIKEEMRAQGINIQKLAELTGISHRYLQALLDADFSQLPSVPYVKGYLESIAKVLGIDPAPLWHEYQKESEIKRSGDKDKLPANRYAQKPLNKTALLITLLVLIGVALLLPKIADFLGRPSIEITSPATDKYTSNSDNFILKGKVNNPQDKLLINSSEVIINTDGTFQQPVILSEPGCHNDYDFTVKRFLGLSTTVKRTICYESSLPAVNPSTSSMPQTH
jgi:cytoskeletal protein RodZ